MHRHHPGDGCDGKPRPIGEEAHHDIGRLMGTMLLDVTRGDMQGVLHTGGYIGVHYGPEGEWVLALRLAHQIGHLTPPGKRDDQGRPNIHTALPPHDKTVDTLAHYCVSMFPELNDHTTGDIAEAIQLARPLVNAFIGHYTADRKDDCRASWESLYEMTYKDTARTRENTLRASAATALLTCWAARYSVMRTPG